MVELKTIRAGNQESSAGIFPQIPMLHFSQAGSLRHFWFESAAARGQLARS
jgi:hypothetical protein